MTKLKVLRNTPLEIHLACQHSARLKGQRVAARLNGQRIADTRVKWRNGLQEKLRSRAAQKVLTHLMTAEPK